MKEFLSLVNEMIGQLGKQGDYFEDTISSMSASWKKLSKEEKQRSLQILDELLRENYRIYICIMSTLLTELEDEELAFYIERMLTSGNIPLWERISDMYQMRTFLFHQQIIQDRLTEYKNQKSVYEGILRDAAAAIQADYSYLPWESRKKKVILVVRQVMDKTHAPTKKLISISKYFRELGYDVSLFVCFHPGKSGKVSFGWYHPYQFQNEVEKTTRFVFDIGEGEQLSGYNLCLGQKDFLQGIRKAMDMIYSERPEFVYELGERTILAGLCNSFTTVVSMGLTKEIPVTNAPIIATYFYYSQAEEELQREYIDDTQMVVSVKHENIGEFDLPDTEETKAVCRQELGIGEDQFVIVIAGNRLDDEITEPFLEILYRILDGSERFAMVFIGDCSKLQDRAAGSSYEQQMYFLGYREDFREAIGIGDIFLNPPRQGGGTGAAFAGILGIPVITLDHCDVESTTGKEFVCGSVEEMPSLVYRYFTDSEFYESRKELLQNRIRGYLEVDSVENFRKLCELVEQITLEKEEAERGSNWQLKEFLGLVNDMIGQLDAQGSYTKATLHKMKISYERLSAEEKRRGLELLAEVLEEDWGYYFLIMSTLLTELKDEDIVYYIEKMLISKKAPLWNRISYMYQLRTLLFWETIIQDKQKDYRNQKVVYEEILQDIASAVQTDYSYLPWKSREKKVILTVRRILGRTHAPTVKLMSIYKYFKELGYEVLVYICFHPGEMKDSFWYDPYKFYSQIEDTMPFSLNIGGGEKICGYNLYLKQEDYLQGIKNAVDMIYCERPEFVFELGERTILAGLCNSFTTVVTMELTKALPVTNAPIIATYFNYSQEEEEMYRQYIDDTQRVISVKHLNTGEGDLSDSGEAEGVSREELGIGEEQFVIVIAGNRLDSEVTEQFLQILYRILEQSEQFVIAFIGDCSKLEKRIAGSNYGQRMLFLGYRSDFREVIGVGDVFLNTPRQGGGTGAACAGLNGVPVITLDHCDVEATAGKEFVCGSLEEIPSLVYKYYTDSEFYERQKEILKNNIRENLAVDSLGNFHKLCELVKQVTLEKEEAYEE